LVDIYFVCILHLHLFTHLHLHIYLLHIYITHIHTFIYYILFHFPVATATLRSTLRRFFAAGLPSCRRAHIPAGFVGSLYVPTCPPTPPVTAHAYITFYAVNAATLLFCHTLHT